jgi:Na+-exporting ATPase
MRRPPHNHNHHHHHNNNNKRGVFAWQLITDMPVYGSIMGGCTLTTFIFIVYGPGKYGLGDDCNRGYNASYDVVLRARAAVLQN